VTTLPESNLPASPSIPLSPDVRAAYQNLYDKIQAQLDSTMNADVVEALNAIQPQVDDVLTKDDLYKIEQNTALFNALKQQISDTNNSLAALKAQIASTASHFAMAADIIAAINKVLTLIPAP
jgi:hypothetical protein